MGYIYKITNQVNGKMYIGKTECIDPYDRWKGHLKASKKQECKNRPLYRAMNKYGVENFIFEPIGQFDNGQELCNKEVEYIAKYRTYIGFKDSNGYNATIGGEGSPLHNLDEQEVISIHKKNNYIIGNTAKYFGVDLKVIKKILHKYNIKWLSSLEFAEMEFLKQYGGVVQFDYDMTHVIDIFNSPRNVIDKNPDYSHKTLHLKLNPNHPTHHAYGYTWYRLYELPEEYKPLLDEYINSDNLEIDETMLDF